MSTYIRYPSSSGTIPTYASFVNLPATATDGSAAITLDTDTLYIYNSGTTTWYPVATPGDALAIGVYDSGSPNANGLHIDVNALIAQSASASVPGMINTGSQTFAGAKTFTGAITASNLSGTNTGDVTLAAIGSAANANGASLSGQVLTLQPASGSFGGVVTTSAQTFAGTKTFDNIIDSGLTANTALTANASKQLTSSATTDTELGYVHGVTSAIQTQLDSKQSATLTSAHLFVGNGSNVATDVAVSGDLTLVNTGAFTVAKIQSTTVSGTTGTTNVVFSASPTLTGTLTGAAATFSGSVNLATGGIGTVGVNTASPSTSFAIDALPNGNSGARVLRCRATDTSTNAGSVAPMIVLKNTSNTDNNYAGMAFENNAGTDVVSVFTRFESQASNYGSFHIYTAISPSGAWADRLNIDSSGNTNVTGSLNVASLTASQAVFTDASKNLVSNAITGTGNVVMSASPTLTGTITAAAINASGTVNLSGLTASLPVQTDGSKNLVSAAIDLSGTQATGILAAGRFPALTGDVTTASGALATTIAANAVTYAKFQQVAASSLVGNATGSLANATGITLGATLAFSGSALQTAALTGDVTASANSFVTTVAKIAGTTVSGTTGSTNVMFSTSPTTTGTLTAAAINASGTVNLSGLTASQAVFTDASKNLVSNAITGTGNVVMSASPTLSGTIAGALTFSGAMTLSSTLDVSGNTSITTAGNTTLTIACNNNATGNAELVRFQNTQANYTYYNWQIGNNWVNNQRFEIVPSTTANNSTYNVPSLGLGTDGQIYGLITNWGSSATQDVGFSVTTGAGAFQKFTSSQRYKHDIQDPQFDTSKLYQMKAKQFRWNSNNSLDFGFIAEEVQAVFPEAVLYQNDENGPILDANGQMIPEAVRYRQLTAIIVAELTKLRQEFDAYKAAHP